MGVLARNKTRLMLPRGAVGYYTSDLLAPLLTASGGGMGVVFPFQPDITYQQSANYSSYDLSHTNYTYNAYRNTSSPTIQLQAQFASATQEEGAYTLAALHFFRSVNKMWSGMGDRGGVPTAGTPPPILRFSSFGEQVFGAPQEMSSPSGMRVVLSNFATTFDSNVDLKLINGQQLPVVMTFALDLLVQITPNRQKNNYSTTNFVNGRAYSEGFI